MSAKRLYGLDKTSPSFPRELEKLLSDREWLKSLKQLPEGEPEILIDHLDNVLGELDPSDVSFRKCLYIFRKICGMRMILPRAYEVSSKLLLDGDPPFACGGFCDAFKGTLGPTEVCIKRLRFFASVNRTLAKQSLCKEAVVWKRLDHPNIVPFKGVTLEPLQLVSEWMSGGDLRRYIGNNPHANLLGLLLDVANGLYYLHLRHVIHGDLKSANILVDSAGKARIVDFGLTNIVRDQTSLISTAEGGSHTPRFTAPEILKGIGRHTKESDVFAFGMVVIEVFTGDVPFKNCINSAVILNTIAGVRPDRPAHPGFTDNLWKTTQECWDEKPQERPRIDSILRELHQVPQSIPMGLPEQYADWDATSEASPPTTTLISSSFPLLFPQFPQAPATFFDRDVILEDLLSFAERCSSVTLLGAGGVGKTAIALALLRHDQIRSRFGGQRYLLSCSEVGNSLDSFISRLSSTIGVSLIDVTQPRSNLGTSPRVLVLDGVDSILDPLAPGAAEITAAIEKIGRCPNVFLIVTSRMVVKIPGFRQVDVPTVSSEGAWNIFHSYCDLGRSTAIDDLLVDLDFHPLSIVLLANAAHQNCWDEPALLEMWNYGETSILEASGHQSLEEYIESILRAPTIKGLEQAARDTLEHIAALPNNIKEIQLLSKLPVTDGVVGVVDALFKFSLVYRQEGIVKMLSPFRLYFKGSAHWVLVPEPTTETTRAPTSGPPVVARKNGTIAGTKLLQKFWSANGKLRTLFRFSVGTKPPRAPKT